MVLLTHTAASSLYTLSLHDALPISVFAAPRGKRPIQSLVVGLPIAAQLAVTLLPAGAGLGLAVREAVEAVIVMVWLLPSELKSTLVKSSHRCVSHAVNDLGMEKATL